MSGYEGTHQDWLEGQASDQLEREAFERERREAEYGPNATRGSGAFTWSEHKVIVVYQDEYELAFNSHEEAVRAAHAILSEVEIARRRGDTDG